MAKSKKAPKAKAHKAAKSVKPKAAKPVKKVVLKPSKPAKAVKPARPVKAVTASAKKPEKPAAKANGAKPPKAAAAPSTETESVLGRRPPLNAKVNSTFLKKQRDRLLQLRDGMVDSMMGVAKDNLRSRAEGSEASAFGMHQADAGSDAYDRDFALSLLSQEQDALYEIDEALKRVDAGNYGFCEMSGKPIPHARLEAIPFARCTVECQSQLEKQQKLSRTRQPVTSLFGLTDDESGESEEEETPADNKE